MRSAAQQQVVDDRTAAKVAKLEKEAKTAKAELEKLKKSGQDSFPPLSGEPSADAADEADTKREP